MPHAGPVVVSAVVVELVESTEDVVVWVVSVGGGMAVVEEPIALVDDGSPEGPSSPQPTSNEAHKGRRRQRTLEACHEHDASLVAMIARRPTVTHPRHGALLPEG